MSKQRAQEVYRIHQSGVVHLTKDCLQFEPTKRENSIRVMDRDTAEAWGLDICKFCTGDHPYQSE